MIKQRLAWAITGSGHYLRESLAVLTTLENVDIFLSKAAAEIIKQYGYQAQLDATQHKVYQDKTASSVPVELFYEGRYHTLIIAPATSNTIVFACDTGVELESEAPRDNLVNVYPRKIDLDNVKKLSTFEYTQIVENIPSLQQALSMRLASLPHQDVD